MSFDEKTLYQLLPAVHRIRDADQGEPLNALLAVIADQVAILEEDLAQLYDNQFVETCAPWVLPYLGDLIGIRGLHGGGQLTRTPRAEVAHTIGYRRRKGTAATLELLARDVTGWPARAVEFFERLAATQYLNHLRPQNQSWLDVRDADALEFLNGPFERAAHTVDVRRITSGRGRYNIPNVGLFLWRLQAYSLTRSPAVLAEVKAGEQRRFLFHPLGISAPLVNRPQTEDEVTHLAELVNVPTPISRRVLDKDFVSVATSGLPCDFYGSDKSFMLERSGAAITDPPAEIGLSGLKVCDLSDVTDNVGTVIDWAHASPRPDNTIAIDPVLGRIVFPTAQDPARPTLVTFHYGFSSNLGSGEYNRIDSIDASLVPVLKVANTHRESFTKVEDALPQLGPKGGVVEIADSGRYPLTLKKIDATGQRIEIRAADKRRPILLLADTLEFTSASEDSEVTLNGLLISGATLHVTGKLKRFRLRHCTLVPGVSLRADGEPNEPDTPSLIVESESTLVEIDHCIVGGLQVAEDVSVHINNSFVDATSETGVAYAHPPVNGGGGGPPIHDGPGGALRVEQCTVIGKVHASVIDLASNTIFVAALKASDDKVTWLGPVQAERRQEGCVRFSYLPSGARVPRRYHCQPENEVDAIRLRPVFNSLRYGQPAYGQLNGACPPEIRRGADDEAEMGAFHDLFQPQREAHLRARLEEYLRFGLEGGVIYVT